MKKIENEIFPIKFPHWSEKPLDYEQYLKNKGKPVSHFKTSAGRYGGKRIIECFYRVYENGIILKN